MDLLSELIANGNSSVTDDPSLTEDRGPLCIREIGENPEPNLTTRKSFSWSEVRKT
jgi:hypothetical protein